jgi:hypothetical protein
MRAVDPRALHGDIAFGIEVQDGAGVRDPPERAGLVDGDA